MLLRHGAFCDERGAYRGRDARLDPATYEEALAYEMQAAAQASGLGGFRAAPAAAGPATPGGGRGRLGPATSLGPGGAGFQTLDASRGAASLEEGWVLDAAEDGAAAAVCDGGGAAYLNLLPFMHQAPMTGGWVGVRVGGWLS